MKALRVIKLSDSQSSMEIHIHHYHNFEAAPRELCESRISRDWPPTYTPGRPEVPGDYPNERRMTGVLSGVSFTNIGKIPPLVIKNSKPEYIDTAAH